MPDFQDSSTAAEIVAAHFAGASAEITARRLAQLAGYRRPEPEKRPSRCPLCGHFITTKEVRRVHVR